MLIAGVHVPVIPLFGVESETKGNVRELPLHTGRTCLKVGTVALLTATSIKVSLAHCPPEGVKVYLVVCDVLMAGDHVPRIPFKEVSGN